MNRSFAFLADRRWAGVALAAVIEVAALVALARVAPNDSIGLPGAVAAAIAGTAAVVYGALDGALIALLGAAAFGTAAGWEVGEAAALVVWPAVVAAAGLFARRVEHRRVALQDVLAAQEFERKRVAIELHEQIAQTLAGALMALRAAAGGAESPEIGELLGHARDLIHQTIQDVRDLSVDLRPRALDDFGVVPAVERLAATLAERSGVPVAVEPTDLERLTPDVELALFRIVEDALTTALQTDPDSVRLSIGRTSGRILIDLVKDGRPRDPAAPGVAFDGVRERVRLLGGRLSVDSPSVGVVAVHAEIRA